MSGFVIVDCGIGNLRSVQKMLERQGVAAPVSGAAATVAAADVVVLPGVGAFGDAMAELRAAGLVDVLRAHALERRKPLLGICLGMQLLARESSEGGRHQGLGLIDAEVRPLAVAGQSDWAGRRLTLPHIGWNAVAPREDSVLFQGIAPGSDFYFVHGYQVVCGDPALAAATCAYGGDFVSAVEQDNIMGVQFHPEKSQSSGQRLLRNFVAHCAGLEAAA